MGERKRKRMRKTDEKTDEKEEEMRERMRMRKRMRKRRRRRKRMRKLTRRIQTTPPTSGEAVTAVTNCRANCVETSTHGGPIYRFLDKPAMRTRRMAGAAPHKCG